MTVIDAHSHFLPPAVTDRLRGGGYPHARVEDRPGSGPWVVCTRGLQFPLTPLFHDVETKLAWMDEHGIDISLNSTAAPLFLYELEADECVRLCREVNDAAAEMAAASGGRLVGVATLPMTVPDAVPEELRRACGELGLKGAEIGPSVGETMLDDASLDPIWAAAAEQGAPVFLHPYTYMLGLWQHPGFDRFFLLNNVGNMLETHLAAGRLTLGGVFDRHPELTIQLAHGGGGLPYQLTRLDHTYELREQVREVASRPPSEYLDNFLFDTVVYDRRPLDYLIERVGVDRVVFGTDHPFDIADLSPLETLSDVDAAVAEKIFEGNARRAYGL